MKKIKLLFLLLLFVSTMVYSQSLFKDKNGILSPTANRSIGVPSLYNFAIGDTLVLRLRGGVTQFYNNGTWYFIPVPSNYVAYTDSITKYMTPNSFLSAFDTRLGTKSTTNLAEGTNLYYTDTRARAAISETITGINYSSGVFSLAPTYFIPRDSMALVWNDKYTQAQITTFLGAKLDTTLATTLLRSHWSTAYSRSISVANDSTNWNTAYTDRLKWDGGAAGLVAATGRASLGLQSMSLVDSVLFKTEMAGLYVPLTRTVNGHALTGNISVTATDVGLGNVTNESKATMFTNPTFTGTVTIPTPFTLGAVSVTTTGTQLNYLSGTTGTTGTGNVVFSASPTFTGVLTTSSIKPTNLTTYYIPVYNGTQLVNSKFYYDTSTNLAAFGGNTSTLDGLIRGFQFRQAFNGVVGVEIWDTINVSPNIDGNMLSVEGVLKTSNFGTHPFMNGIGIAIVIDSTGGAPITQFGSLSIAQTRVPSNTTKAAAIYIQNPPIGAANNYAIQVDNGTCIFGPVIANNLTLNSNNLISGEAGYINLSGGLKILHQNGIMLRSQTNDGGIIFRVDNATDGIAHIYSDDRGTGFLQAIDFVRGYQGHGLDFYTASSSVATKVLSFGIGSINATFTGTINSGAITSTGLSTIDSLKTTRLKAISTGTAPIAGEAVLVSGTVTVSTTAVRANSVIVLTRKASGGTIGTAITYTIVSGTSFTINTDNVLDTSTFRWAIINPY